MVLCLKIYPSSIKKKPELFLNLQWYVGQNKPHNSKIKLWHKQLTFTWNSKLKLTVNLPLPLVTFSTIFFAALGLVAIVVLFKLLCSHSEESIFYKGIQIKPVIGFIWKILLKMSQVHRNSERKQSYAYFCILLSHI